MLCGASNTRHPRPVRIPNAAYVPLGSVCGEVWLSLLRPQ